MPAISISSAASFESRSGAKPPSSPTAVDEPAVVERALERVEDLDAGAQPLGEGGRAHGHDHELLEVDLVVGVRAAVQHVHHRHGQHVRLRAAKVSPQRRPGLGRGRLGRRQRHAQNRVGAEPRLVRSAVELDHRAVEGLLVGGIEPVNRLRELAVHVRDCLGHALASPGVAAVTKLHGLELARGGARGHGGAARGPGLQEHVHLDGRVPPGVEDLARVDLLDAAHSASTCARKRSAACRRASSGSAPASSASRTAASRRSPGSASLGSNGLLGALEDLLGVERRGQRLRDLAEDLAAALVLALDLVPVAHHVAGGVRRTFSEHVRVAADQLLAAVLGHLGQAPLTALLEEQGQEVDLEEHVAELVKQLGVIARVGRVRQLVGLLDRVRDDRALVLLPVPGTLPAEPACDLVEPLEGS